MYRSHRMKVVVSRASHVHHMPQAGLPHNGPVRIGVGRIAKDSPSLRTGQAGHPHPALQSVVLPPRGLTNLCMGNCQGEQPMLGKESIHLPPLTPLLEGRQHPFRPNLRFHPGPLGPDFSRLFSPFGHCRRFCFRLFARHVSTFLRPFAPGPLRPFLATMSALSPARPGSSAPACMNSGSLLRTGLPDSRAQPSNHSVSNHPPWSPSSLLHATPQL